MNKPNLFQQVMDEHITLPGVRGVIVTRGYAYQWLKDIGYSPDPTGFGSIDYAVFHQRPTDEPLTDIKNPDLAQFLTDVKRSIKGEL